MNWYVPEIVDSMDFSLKSLSEPAYIVNPCTRVAELARYFDQNPEAPGVVIISEEGLLEMISRQRCYEVLGRPYGVDLFMKLPVIDFYRMGGVAELFCLPQDVRIEEAVRLALTRTGSETYEPIVVCLENGGYHILDIRRLLSAHSDMMIRLLGEVRELAITDGLTSVYNRRGFFNLAENLIDQTIHQGDDLSMLMVDIDHFKRFNDQHGHQVGDLIIQAVVNEIQRTVRQTDIVGRYGGEEFVVLLPGSSLDVALQVGERIRQNIENLLLVEANNNIGVSVSIGISHLDLAEGLLDRMLAQADRALYTAKRSGRNQVVVWANSMEKQLPLLPAVAASPNRSEGQPPADLQNLYEETVQSWIRILELHEKESLGHAERVTRMTVAAARKAGIPETAMEHIRLGAMLHDIGKIAIPDSILFKPGKLNEDEWEIMRRHPVFAYDFLSPISYFESALQIPYCHHEHWDGSGYPRGLKGDHIPLPARIFTIVDVWDALSTDRCYRAAWPPEKVREHLIQKSGKLFDPDLLTVFLEILDEREEQNGNLPKFFLNSLKMTMLA